MPVIAFEDVDFSYVDANESFLALEGINLQIQDGEFVCLVGHSGCGKSTMLNLVAGLELPTRGRVLVDGAEVKGPGLDRSVVFQTYSLFPWLSAVRNVMFALRQANKGITKTEARERAMELLAQVGVQEAADRYPFQLSGGMRQRVAIARALAVDAPTMLLDEPFGALDPMIRRRLQLLLLDLWREGGCCKTAVFVTHDIDEALVLADRIVFMEPKHVRASFDLPKDRERDADAVNRNPETREIKDELLRLFKETAPATKGVKIDEPRA